jgi:hypothetical protein
MSNKMKGYAMSSDKCYSWGITKKQYNYLLPAIKKNLLTREGQFFFIGTEEEYDDMRCRLKYLD